MDQNYVGELFAVESDSRSGARRRWPRLGKEKSGIRPQSLPKWYLQLQTVDRDLKLATQPELNGVMSNRCTIPSQCVQGTLRQRMMII
jgi:hypothetical protein